MEFTLTPQVSLIFLSLFINLVTVSGACALSYGMEGYETLGGNQTWRRLCRRPWRIIATIALILLGIFLTYLAARQIFPERFV